ncbi:MAG: sulfite exporter TauE/SafE family protein [Methylocapsa sp.]|nr:sulfite exporter TauE/SafE family protein [Methylocapsa sp.]
MPASLRAAPTKSTSVESLPNFLLVAAAAFGAGFLNAVAGGGSFLTFPALIAAGLPAIDANASNTAALFPAQIATGFAARSGLARASAEKSVNMPVLAAISLIGGILGGLLLLLTPQKIFSRLVPWLILFATFVFAGGNFLIPSAKRFRVNETWIFIAQGLVAVYGGYFGGGIGILMLAALTLFGLRDIWLMNSIKILLSALMNASAAITFVIAGAVHWRWTALVAIGAIAGGYAGLHAARGVDPKIVKGFVTGVGIALTVYFFLKPA